VASVYLKGSGGTVYLTLTEYNSSNTYLGQTLLAITPTGTWTRYTVNRITAPTGAKMRFLCTTDTAVASTFYTDGLKLERVNSLNLVPTYNVANCCEGGTTTGFTAMTSTISSSTEQAHQGSRSLKVAFNGAQTTEGAYCAEIPIENSWVYYNISFWVKGTAGKKAGMTREWRDASHSNVDAGTTQITLDGNWQQISVPKCSELGVAKFLQLYLTNGDVMDAHTVYFDQFQVEKGSVETTWAYPLPTDWETDEILAPQGWGLGMPIGIAEPAPASPYPYTLYAVQHESHIDLTWSEP
jgi:hypothetical protein